MDNTKEKNNDLTSGPLTIKIIKFIIPLMLTGILQLLYNAADSIVVGHYDGSSALAAVSSVGALINLLVNAFMGLSVGAAVVVAQDYGAKDYEGVSKTVHTSYLISIIGGIVVGAIGLIFSRQFLIWMGSPEDVLPLSTEYLMIYFIGTPANMAYNFGASILRSIGDTKRPLYFLTISGLVNVVLNLVLVIVFHMGVAGVAYATIISQILSAVMVIVYMMKSKDCVRFVPKKMRIHGDKLKKMLYIGLPAGFQGTVFSLSNVVIQSAVNSFGSLVMAGNGAASSLEGFTYTAMNSVYQASLTFVGQNVGAKKYDRINKVQGVCLVLVTIIGLVFGVTTYCLGEPLLSIYLPNDPEAIPYGIIRMSYIALPYFLCGMMEVMVGGQRGMGMSFIPMINALLGSCVLRIVWISTVFAADPTLFTLYISYPISWIVTTLAHTVFYFVKLHSLKKKARLEAGN
ncbi:MAG: MATE family efflux transporter [Eubacteriales bacterium]|nr:MATE family efflux transporter [Clostridia bacterium]MDY2844966.1 MATE family efflux transporter [Eubacteriales bacterium]